MVVINVLLFIISISILYYLQKKYVSFNKRVLAGLFLGALIAFICNIQSHHNTNLILNLANLVGISYIRLLQMLIFPVIIISILSAMTKVGENSQIGKAIFYIVAILIGTTAIASIVAIFITLGFNIDITPLLASMADTSALLRLEDRSTTLADRSFYQIFTDFIPRNPFDDITGSRPSSIGATVVFFMIVGIAYLGVNRKEPEIGAKFKRGVEVIFKIVMRVVILVLRLTPYGIFALIVRMGATISQESIFSLFTFILISYLAIFVMFIIHFALLRFAGYNIILYIKKVAPLLLFAFSSRSSASSIPLNINTQVKHFGVNESIATTSASFGATMGQNGCAGIYPAMLAVLVAPTIGIDPTSLSFLIPLVLFSAISSFGIAGIGGGATFAAIAIFSFFNMPLTLVAILVAVEPLIDMARTALNVNGAVSSSLISAKFTDNIDKTVFNDPNTVSELTQSNDL